MDFFDPTFLVSVSAVLSVLTLVGVQFWMRGVRNCISKQPWWPTASKLQKAMMMGTGKTEEQCGENQRLDSYTWVLFVCIHHAIAGGVMLPVVILGWAEAGLLGQQLFAIGGMLCIGFDVEDLLTSTLLFFCQPSVACLGEPVQGRALVITVFHHALSISMFLPCLIFFNEERAFHFICCSLLLAAGIAYGFGSYKFTLDTKIPSNFCRYKIVVIIQFTVIWYTRCILWFPSAWAMLQAFSERSPPGYTNLFYYGGCVVVTTMSIFNLVMLADCTLAAIKWLPRKMPSNATDQAELAMTMAASSNAQRGQTFGNAEQVASDRGYIAKRSSLQNLAEEFNKDADGKLKETEL